MLCPIVCVEYYYEVITSYAGDPVLGDKSGNFKHTVHSNYEKKLNYEKSLTMSKE